MKSFFAIGPILRALARHKTRTVFVVIQMAFTLGVVVNCFTLLTNRVEVMQRPTGLEENDLFSFRVTAINSAFNPKTAVLEDLDYLRSNPGVVAATQTNTMPLSGSGWSMTVSSAGHDSDEGININATKYMMDVQGTDTTGIKIVAGRSFTREDVYWSSENPNPPNILISSALANILFPDVETDDIVGKPIFHSDTSQTIVGIYERLQVPWPSVTQNEYVSMIVPQQLDWTSYLYLVRTLPGLSEKLMPEIEDALYRMNSSRLVRDMRTFSETRDMGYLVDNTITVMLAVTMSMLLVVTSFGVAGLATFSVRQRYKQIGIRRALGAERSDIAFYFLVEISLITAIAMSIGTLIAFGISVLLVQAFEFPLLNVFHLALGWLGVWLIGLLATWGPAHKASRIDPAIATRTL